jgi:hypothetical protein|tara:strand:- start:141 stop:632 length:492 start_codon:yes stop_codon:yes gene_type:complete
MKHKIIDNFLSEEKFFKVKNSILKSEFTWNLNPWVSNLEETLKTTSSYYFTHLFYCGLFIDQDCDIFIDILNQLEVKSLIRIKANLYPSTDNIEYLSEHIDYEYEHRGAIFYLNTNNGYTILADGTKVESIENRILLFDPSKPHNSTTCTDDKCRVNINFNFF